jgi:hypothetical protein
MTHYSNNMEHIEPLCGGEYESVTNVEELVDCHVCRDLLEQAHLEELGQWLFELLHS